MAPGGADRAKEAANAVAGVGVPKRHRLRDCGKDVLTGLVFSVGVLEQEPCGIGDMRSIPPGAGPAVAVHDPQQASVAVCDSWKWESRSG